MAKTSNPASPGTSPAESSRTRRRKGRIGTGSIYRRGNVWWVKIYHPDGQPVSQSSKSADYGDGKKLRQKTSGEKSRGEVSGGALGKVRISELLDDVLQSDIADSTRKIWKMVIEKSTRPFFGKVKSTRLTTEIMKAYRGKKLADVRVTPPPTAS